MTDLVFLKALRDKLKGGNTRSIHLNMLPGRYAARLDLANLNYIQPVFAERFLNLLLSNSTFEFKISFDGVNLNAIQTDEQKRLGLLSKRLNSLNIENDDNYKEHGIKTFGFGFPILIKPSRLDPKKIIKAPLFIWQLEIIKATNKVNTWSILRNKTRNENGKIVDEEIHSVALNEVLLSFLKTDENIIIPQINEELLEDAVIDKKQLINECCKILTALNANLETNVNEGLQKKFNEPLKNIPEAAILESVSSNVPWIHFGGVFGLFRTQKESIITDIDKIIEKFDEYDFENLKVDNFPGTAHSAIETDPSQQEILTSLGIEPKKIIQGPPGTGKSQSLTALITNALANNLKCLVVCEKKTALEVIKNNLHKENDQLGALAAVIEDVNTDRDGIVNSVRDRLSNLSQYASFNQTNYNNVRQTVEQKVKELNHQHQQLDKKIYQGKSWTELVGEFLKRQKVVDFAELKQKLDYKQFKFQNDEKELSDIVGKIKTAKKLYSDINRLDHPLEILKDEVFKQDSPRAVQLRIEDFSKSTSEKLLKLERELQNQLLEYQKWLDSHFAEYYYLIKQQINSYKEFVTSNHNEFGELFFRNNVLAKFQILSFSIVSKRYKILKGNRIELVSQISKIKEVHQTLKYFEHTYVNDDQIVSLKEFVENIDELSERADEWFCQNENIKQNYIQNFSYNHLHPLFTNREPIVEAENQFNRILSGLKEEELLKRDFSIATTHKKKILEIVKLLSEMETICDNLEDFREYFTWRKFYIELSTLQKMVVKSLIELSSKNWEIAFESWYYHWLLAIAEGNLKGLPKSDDKIIELCESKEQLKKIQIKSIVNNWSVRQYQSVKRAQSQGVNPISLFNKRGSRGERRNSLRKIINTDFESFTNFFPVVMLSPTVCSSIIPLEEAVFDIVIFDEASQLRLEDTFPALIRGKIKVVSGDSQQMPPSNFFQGGTALLNPTDDDYEVEEQSAEQTQNLNRNINNSLDLADSESLLVYAENCSYKQSYLKVHYRSQHPYLIDFSNHAFYGKRLIPMPAKRDYRPIQYIEVNGLYEDQVNRDEAKQVVDILLNHIKPFKNGKFPSVGVATFNLYQRNLILEEITKARQLKPEYDKKIADLGSDWFVKNLENIQGDERDIIIISTTFGRRTDGSFRQNFGPILQRNGYKLLNVIITRAKYKVYVCTSIPQENISSYSSLLKQMKNNGRAIFYAYLAYAKSVSDNNLETKDSLLQQIYENCESKTFEVNDPDIYGSESPFEEEVYYRLAAKVGQGRLQQQYKIGGFRIDLVIKSRITGSPVIAIECDGAKYHSSNEAYAWDMFRQSHLEKQGFIFYRIWSTNWWYSPEKELKKLVDFISKFDNGEKSETEKPADDFFQTHEIKPVTTRPEMQ